jgi:hypothetical protein
MSPVTYQGRRAGHGGLIVTKHVDDLPPVELDLRLDLRNHSPTGFELGYSGSGPAQLALAITADVLGDDHARHVYQDFKQAFVARWPREGFAISAEAVEGWAEELERKDTQEGHDAG